MSTLAATNLKNPSSGSNNVVLNTDGTTTIAAPSNIIKSGTAVASTSGTAIDFTSIPSWVKRVAVMFNGVSTNGSSTYQIQLGTSSGFVTTGYLGSTDSWSTSVSANLRTTGFGMTRSGSAATVLSGNASITGLGNNVWSASSMLAASNNPEMHVGAGSVTLSGTLDRIRITTVNGTDTFDAGSINILYEG